MHFVIKVLLLFMPWEISARTMTKTKQARLSLAEPMNSVYFDQIDNQAGTYGFGYEVSDLTSGNNQYRNEERFANGTVVGSYGYLDPNGKPQFYRYIADRKGYRVMRERPFSFSSPAKNNLSSSPNQQNNEITWTRKKSNDAIINSYIQWKMEERKSMQHPFRYYMHT